MPTQDSCKVATTLERLAAQGATNHRIADAVVSTWLAVDAALAPVIGGRGVVALYDRSLYTMIEHHRWLGAASEGAGGQMDLELLRATLAQQDARAGATAAGDHFTALYDLLVSLIGPSLTGQLLRTAWDNPFGGPADKDRTQ